MAVKRGLLAFLLLICGVVLTAGVAHSQETAPLPNPTRTASRLPLFWADGITQIADLDDYQAMGFNVVVVRLTWSPAPDGAISAQNLAPQRAFAAAAAKRGLQIIYALPAAPSGMETAFRLSADSDAYVSLWTTWLQDAVAALRDTPNLLGWMLPDDPRGLALFDDIGFQRWLAQNYADVGFINRQWNATFRSMDDISLADVADLVSVARGDPVLTASERQSGDSQFVHTLLNQNGSFHPAALAVANYKWDAYRALLATWVGALRGEDSTHLVFSGSIPDYAQLLSLPSGIDVVVPFMAPGVAENDIVTHNPQSIDVARRGGRFGVWPLLSPREGAELPASALPDLTRRWMEEACTRGARGVGFDDFENLREVPGLAKVVGDTLEKLKAPPYAALWGVAPVNTTAILLTPLADGTTPQFGAPPNSFPRGLYGFGEDLVSGEPSNLVWMMRWGTAFGGVDYLAPDDLAEIETDHYTTILAPQTLSATSDTTAQLSSYVAGGGVLVADLGMGAMQNGGTVNALTPPLANLFGVPGQFDVRPITFNLIGMASHPLLPSWGSMIAERPGVSLTLGDGPNSSAFAGPVGLSVVSGAATILATSPRISQEYGPIKRVLSAQFTLNSVGRGTAIFAPFRLWSNWRPGHAGFDTFFGDLMSRGATVVMAGATSLVPSPVTANIGSTVFCEVTNHNGGLSLTNHNAPGVAAQMPVVQTSGAGDWLWSGGITYFPNDANAPVVGGRTAPIDNPTEFEERARPVVLYGRVESGASLPMMMRPVSAQNLAGGPLAAQVIEETKRHLKVSVWPNSPTVLPGQDGWQTTLGQPAPVRLTVAGSSDGYQTTPGSRHRVVITDYARSVGKNKFQSAEKIVVADATGRFNLEFTGIACVVEITPLP